MVGSWNGSAHRGGLGVDAGEVAVERAGGVGEPEHAGPLEEARRLEAAGEEHELDIGAEVDDVESERGRRGGAGRALQAPDASRFWHAAVLQPR